MLSSNELRPDSQCFSDNPPAPHPFKLMSLSIVSIFSERSPRLLFQRNAVRVNRTAAQQGHWLLRTVSGSHYGNTSQCVTSIVGFVPSFFCFNGADQGVASGRIPPRPGRTAGFVSQVFSGAGSAEQDVWTGFSMDRQRARNSIFVGWSAQRPTTALTFMVPCADPTSIFRARDALRISPGQVGRWLRFADFQRRESGSALSSDFSPARSAGGFVLRSVDPSRACRHGCPRTVVASFGQLFLSLPKRRNRRNPATASLQKYSIAELVSLGRTRLGMIEGTAETSALSQLRIGVGKFSPVEE